MAKALIGYMNSDPRMSARTTAENVRLRMRVAELEALVLRLTQENDALTAAHAAALDAALERESQALSEMQPA